MERLIVSEKIGCTKVLLIDYFVKDTSVLIESSNDTTLPILYSYLSSKIELLDELRKRFVSFERLGLLFTQGNANLFLDKKHFFVQENIDFMIQMIKEFNIKHVDFLACETLSYPVWTKYYDLLQEETEIILGASSNKTGNLKIVSDWVMENTEEDVELVYFTTNVQLYKYLLDDEPPNSKIDENYIDE